MCSACTEPLLTLLTLARNALSAPMLAGFGGLLHVGALWHHCLWFGPMMSPL